MILEHEVVITVPVETEMKGVLFSLHGCLQLTKEWGFPSETCPGCHGKLACSALHTAAVARTLQLVHMNAHSGTSLPHHSRHDRWYKCLASLTSDSSLNRAILIADSTLH